MGPFFFLSPIILLSLTPFFFHEYAEATAATIDFTSSIELQDKSLENPKGKTCSLENQRIQCGVYAVCNDGMCGDCRNTTQCKVSNPKFVCEAKASGVGKECTHKQLFPNMDRDDIVATILAFVASAVAAAGGIGGGGVLVPMYMLVAKFTAKGAIPLSKATIFGGAIMNYIINSMKRHPLADRPIINFEVALLFEPMQLAGTLVGTMCNRIFPEWLITALLILLLGYTTVRTTNKGIKTWRQESRASYQMVDAIDDKDKRGGGGSMADVMEGSGAGGNVVRLREIIDEDKKVPMGQVACLLLIWIVVQAIAYLKGGHGHPSPVGLRCGSPAYMLLVVGAFAVAMISTFFIGQMLVERHEEREELGFQYAKGDPVWDKKSVVTLPLICTMAGFAAGLLGIGGGMVTGPLMLELNINPQVSAATAAFMVLFTSSATSFQFMILGSLKEEYAMWFACLGFLGALVGQKVVGYLIKKYKKQSFVVFALAIVIGLSTVLMGGVGISDVITDLADGVSMGFHNMCLH